ncbi:50S ribosomal protein L19 [Patescibacteria group bacterium]|nr:50S ribosomal protein L19 [Patescibacteria group bacterium]MBU4481745.1 50S ribosomal protein L19 [Patescibacteria group bacterium]
MSTKLKTFINSQLKTDLPDIRPGDTVKIHQKIPAPAEATAGKKEAPKESKLPTGQGYKERLQTFEGIVIARKHGREAGATITVRREISGIGVERVFPIHSPTLEKIEVLRRVKVRRAKLYYLRKAKGKKAKLRSKEIKK